MTSITQSQQTPQRTSIQYNPIISPKNQGRTVTKKPNVEIDITQNANNYTSTSRISQNINNLISPKNERSAQQQVQVTPNSRNITNQKQLGSQGGSKKQFISPKKSITQETTRKSILPNSVQKAGGNSLSAQKKEDGTQKSQLVQSQTKKNKEIIASVAERISQNSELINIKVPRRSRVKQGQESNGKVEIWNGTYENHLSNGLDITTTTYHASDIADEFEYQYNPKYKENADQVHSPSGGQSRSKSKPKNVVGKRFMSPQLDQNNRDKSNRSNQRASVSQARSKSNKGRNSEINQTQDSVIRTSRSTNQKVKNSEQTEQFIKNKITQHIKNQQQQLQPQKSVLSSNRQSKIQKQPQIQNTDGKESLSPRVQIQNEFASPSPKKRNKTKSPGSQRNSQAPNSALQSAEKTFERLYNLRKTVDQVDSQNQSPNQNSQKKKLKTEECEMLYNRMKDYEQKKRYAIQMLQEAKRKEEDDEYLQSVYNSKQKNNKLIEKMSTKQKQHCYDRLAQDAEKRKTQKIKSLQQQVIQQEQEMRELFKPKINTNYKPPKRDANTIGVYNSKFIDTTNQTQTVHSDLSGVRDLPNNNLGSIVSLQTQSVHQVVSPVGGLTLEQKIALFQSEAHYKKNNKQGNL
ncbi:UNKNOWN [Stylonychia lemnae]|uniref:Uncharacterized protein n=1 Tax=Stylonychia lemnae TaxID=5949 RepID=A0A078A5A1_STYLE|nr:UNKNOWN [Stylonychia lemnae]|eukprot:CDW77405.1 UNKNOWN [Stylonychia lemnae]